MSTTGGDRLCVLYRFGSAAGSLRTRPSTVSFTGEQRRGSYLDSWSHGPSRCAHCAAVDALQCAHRMCVLSGTNQRAIGGNYIRSHVCAHSAAKQFRE
jgi:hypothetical protein